MIFGIQKYVFNAFIAFYYADDHGVHFGSFKFFNGLVKPEIQLFNGINEIWKVKFIVKSSILFRICKF